MLRTAGPGTHEFRQGHGSAPTEHVLGGELVPGASQSAREPDGGDAVAAQGQEIGVGADLLAAENTAHDFDDGPLHLVGWREHPSGSRAAVDERAQCRGVAFSVGQQWNRVDH